MNASTIAYLDHAATSWPKPKAVLAAMQRWYDEVGVSADRGDGARCQIARREVDTARRLVADLTGTTSERVAFHSGATESLNLVLRALLGNGDAVVTTAYEHSSVVRPLVALQRERALRLHVVPPSREGASMVAAMQEAIATMRPRVVVLTHASNVTGVVLDAAVVCAAARAVGAISVLDASQSAGLLDLRVGADFTIASAHKALHGPPGLGFVASSGRELAPQKQGGTGSSAALAEHPTSWPAAFEAGTPNTPAIFGLAAALRELGDPRRSLDAALERVDAIVAALSRRAGYRVLHPANGPRVPVVSFVHEAFDPAEIGALLDAAGVHVRTGFHCAPWLHEPLGTAAGGTVRISTSATTTAADVAALLAALP